jgi:hypothetical protein
LKEGLKENQNEKLKVFSEQSQDDECLLINTDFIEALNELPIINLAIIFDIYERYLSKYSLR